MLLRDGESEGQWATLLDAKKPALAEAKIEVDAGP
jgi:hypothetical protein